MKTLCFVALGIAVALTLTGTLIVAISWDTATIGRGLIVFAVGIALLVPMLHVVIDHRPWENR